MSTSIGSDQLINTKCLEDLSNTELIRLVQDLQVSSKRMDLENQIFENFLIANEPGLIAMMGHTLEAVKKLNTQYSYKPQLPPLTGGSPTSISRVSTLSVTDENLNIDSSVAKSKSDRGPRINFSQKTDFVLREIEEMQTSLMKFIGISHRKKSNLQAEIEESNIRAQEVDDSRNDFEQTIVIEAVEKLTQKIPAEKFVRYMQEWLKTAQIMVEKLRLRTSSLRTQQAKLKNLLVQKEELGECVHEVDFEKLKIENKNFQLSIEQKNSHLLELKRINGNANLMLTNHKKILQKQDEALRNLKKTVKATQKRIIELEEENNQTENELTFEKAKFKQLKKKARLYRVPDVMELIRKKAELDELNKTLKTWRRKSNIQKIALSTYTKMMIHITGAPRPRASWYNVGRSDRTDDMILDFPDNSDTLSDSSVN
ncbi:protein of unknown function (DUF4201) [Popillia japonica]|uniref:Cilia- and flagella-associated protein 263 n=1 Tax=Popillia japonica TaxID=7064 RepID=A0AAW1KH76_POPJA